MNKESSSRCVLDAMPRYKKFVANKYVTLEYREYANLNTCVIREKETIRKCGKITGILL